MARSKVFVCYSHDDRKLFEEFLTRLDPLKHQGSLEVWTDQEIMAGEDWEPDIHRAIDRADAAVVLVSPDLLASDFVRRNEIPRLLAARQERSLKLLPLFLRPANADLVTFSVETGDGERRIALTDLEGLNDPKKPLAAHKRAARDDALAAAARRLLETLEALEESAPRPDKPRRELTVVLELRARHVARRFGHPPYYELHSSRGPVDLRRLGAEARRPPDELGRQLFELLLGPEAERQEILSKAYGRDVPDPLRHAFRIRVRTDDEELRALPWALCRWRKHLLAEHGWSFELAAGDRPRPIEHLHTPCRALMVVGAEAPDGPPLRAEAHARGLEGLLRRAWKLPLTAVLLHRAQTLEEIERQLERAPDLFYVYGHSLPGDGGLELLLAAGGGAGPAPVPFSTLAGLAAVRPPRVVVLGTVGEGPLAPPIPGAAATVHLRHPASSDEVRSAAAFWWQAVLGTGSDPVRAFRELPPAARHRGAVTTDYRDWTLDLSESVPKVDRPRAHLDRRDQRRVVLEAVEELVRQPRRRVTCLVAYGAEGNLVHHFAVQMLATLKERAKDTARLEPHPLALPRKRDAVTAAAIEEALREALELQPSDPLNAAFRQARRGGPRARPVHFLDWGTYGDGHDPPLTVGHLETWLHFCRDELEAACPADARILAYLSLVSDASRHQGLDEIFKTLKLRHHAPHFDLVALPALGTVEPEDLLRFLADDNNSSCPPALQGALPERIVRRTGGSFEETVELLEDTERGNRWYELDEELPDAAPETGIDPERLL